MLETSRVDIVAATLTATIRNAAPEDTLRVVPLGGPGEIGRNMTVFDHTGRLRMGVDPGDA